MERWPVKNAKFAFLNRKFDPLAPVLNNHMLIIVMIDILIFIIMIHYFLCYSLYFRNFIKTCYTICFRLDILNYFFISSLSNIQKIVSKITIISSTYNLPHPENNVVNLCDCGIFF